MAFKKSGTPTVTPLMLLLTLQYIGLAVTQEFGQAPLSGGPSSGPSSAPEPEPEALPPIPAGALVPSIDFGPASGPSPLSADAPGPATASIACDLFAALSVDPNLAQTTNLTRTCLPLINATGLLPTYITFFAPNDTAWIHSNFTQRLSEANLTLDDLVQSTAICNILAYHILPASLTSADINATALAGTGFPFSSSTTATLPTALGGNHNLTVVPKSKLSLWGDLQVKWNNASDTGADLLVCDYSIQIINNVLLPYKVSKIPAWNVSFPVGWGPNAKLNGALGLHSGATSMLLGLAGAMMMMLVL